jgi:hypothetical protein
MVRRRNGTAPSDPHVHCIQYSGDPHTLADGCHVTGAHNVTAADNAAAVDNVTAASVDNHGTKGTDDDDDHGPRFRRRLLLTKRTGGPIIGVRSG